MDRSKGGHIDGWSLAMGISRGSHQLADNSFYCCRDPHLLTCKLYVPNSWGHHSQSVLSLMPFLYPSLQNKYSNGRLTIIYLVTVRSCNLNWSSHLQLSQNPHGHAIMFGHLATWQEFTMQHPGIPASPFVIFRAKSMRDAGFT